MRALCRSRLLISGTLVCAALGLSGRASAQEASISGEWTLDRVHSEFPAEVGFSANFMPENPTRDSASGGRGRGRAGRGNPEYSRPDSADDGARVEQLTSAVRTPPIDLVIDDAGASITITADGLARIFHPNAKEESISLDRVTVPTVTTRVGGNVVVVYHAAEGRDVRYTYWRSASPAQLVVDAAFVERGETVSIRRVYAPGKAAPAAPAATTASASPPRGAEPASPAPSAHADSAPPVAQGPDAELRGITRIGVEIEELSKQAAGCGLARDAIEAAVTKSISDHGFTVVRQVTSDDNTYIYVNVMTTATASGLCVSRYDVSLLTHTAAKLSYQPALALVQVQLAHAGSLTGGDAKTHADAVMHGVTQYVDDITARVRSAGSQPSANRQ